MTAPPFGLELDPTDLLSDGTAQAAVSGFQNGPGLHRQQGLALQLLERELADDLGARVVLVALQLLHLGHQALGQGSVRGEALAQLPEEEAQVWRQFWADVNELYSKAGGKASKHAK